MGMDLTKGSIRNPSVHRPSVTGRVSFRAKAFGQMSPTWVEDFFIVVHKPLNCMVHEIEAKGHYGFGRVFVTRLPYFFLLESLGPPYLIKNRGCRAEP